MHQLQHFSHEHPLIFNEEKNIDDEINRDHFCSICSLPILLSSFYSCNAAGCMYLLHKPCALLPETMSHPWFPSSHFRLLEKPPIDHDNHCKKCRQHCESFTYINNSDPNISFHPMCGVPMSPIESKHKSHPLHPLVAVGKRTSAVCDACGEEQNGYFFTCHRCNFFIHVDCALLPQIIESTKHRHYLILTYSNCDMYHAESILPPRHLVCQICSKEMFGSGAYSCAVCIRFAHVSCAIKSLKGVGTEEDLRVTYLPQADQSWIIRYLLEIKPRRNPALDRKLLHDHPLILYNDTESSDSGGSNSSNEVPCCNACIEPIYPPFYACSDQSSRCHFHLHQLCSALPSKLHNNRRLRTGSTKSLCSLFYCSMCRLLGNGFSYHKLNDVDHHITCASIRGLIKHASHKQHFLHSMANQSKYTIKKCCSDPKTDYGYLYRCFDCDFIIDNVCAYLPGKIKHKYDIHPLDLITTGIAILDDNNLCEFCEEQIDTRFWYYGCEECDNLFHVKCIPSAGSLSKVKFGSSIHVSCHPPHPVTFVRMLGFGSQRCGYCKEIVEGFVDEMAFHCSNCDFWMHFKCAEECTGAIQVLPPRGKFVLLPIN